MLTRTPSHARPHAQARASAYVASMARDPQRFAEAARRLGSPAVRDEVRFWCCQTLVEGVRAQLEAAADGAASELRAAGAERAAIDAAVGFAAGALCEEGAGGAGGAPAYVRNKAAQLLALAVGAYYAAGHMPGVFAALCGASDRGTAGADMLARCMLALEEDVVGADAAARSAAAGAAARATKDAMRASGAVAELFAAALRAAGRGGDEGGACLSALAAHVHWADVGLLANAHAAAALARALGGAHAALREGAARCLEACATKSMDCGVKLGLLRELALPAACAEGVERALSEASARGGGLDALAAACDAHADACTLAATVACELLLCHRNAGRPAVVALTAPPEGGGAPAADEPPAAEVAARREWAGAQLDALAPRVLRVAGGAEAGTPTARAAMGFLERFVAHVRRGDAEGAASGGGLGGAETNAGAQGLGAVDLALHAISSRITYRRDEWLDVAGKGSSSVSASVGAAAGVAASGALIVGTPVDEELEEFEEARAEALAAFRNLCRCAPARCAAFALEALAYAHESCGVGALMVDATADELAGATATTAPTPTPGSAARLEAALTMLHRLGEGMVDEVLGTAKPPKWGTAGAGAEGNTGGGGGGGGGGGDGGLGESDARRGLRATLAVVLGARELPHGARRAVALARLEVTVRYAPLLRREPALVAPALRAFLGPHGMRHPSPAVSGRAGYLFCRFVKVFSKGGELLPHLEEAVNAVGDLLAPAAEAAGKAAPVGATVRNAPDDKLYVFEAVGNMLGLEAVPEQAQASHTSAVVNLLAGGLAGMDDGGAVLAEPAASAAAAAVTKLCVCVAALSKGFPKKLLAARPAVAAPLVGALGLAARATRRLGGGECGGCGARAARARVAALLHRLVEAVGAPALEHVPLVVELLLSGGEAADLTSAMTLCGQLATRFRGDAAAGELVCGAMGRLVPLTVAMVNGGSGSGAEAVGGNGSAVGIVGDAASQNTEEARVRNELQKAIIALSFSLTTAALCGALLTPTPAGPPCLDALASLMLTCTAEHPEMGVRKLCVSTAANMVREWLPRDANALVQGFDTFAIDRFAVDACLQMPLRPGFPLKDAGAAMALGEAAKFLLLVAERRPERVLAHTQAVLAGSATAAEACTLLAGGVGGGPALRKVLTRAGEEARAAAAPAEAAL